MVQFHSGRLHAPVAQGTQSTCTVKSTEQAGGSRSESWQAHQYGIIAQFGRATGSYPGGRRFDACWSHSQRHGSLAQR